MIICKKISADLFFHRKIFPVIWYGFVLFAIFDAERQNLVIASLFGITFSVMLYFFEKHFIGRLMDEVNDYGDYLFIKYKNNEDKVYFNNIKSVHFNSGASPQKVTLSLLKHSTLGNEIVFSPIRPKFVWFDYKKNEIVDSLIARVSSVKLKSSA